MAWPPTECQHHEPAPSALTGYVETLTDVEVCRHRRATKPTTGVWEVRILGLPVVKDDQPRPSKVGVGRSAEAGPIGVPEGGGQMASRCYFVKLPRQVPSDGATWDG
jgi:hypothetical protein